MPLWALLLLSLSGCQDTPIPKWDPSAHGGLWVGSKANFGLVRKQAAQICRADQDCINNYVAFTLSGFANFYETYILGCEKWKATDARGNAVNLELMSQAIARLKAEAEPNENTREGIEDETGQNR